MSNKYPDVIFNRIHISELNMGGEVRIRIRSRYQEARYWTAQHRSAQQVDGSGVADG